MVAGKRNSLCFSRTVRVTSEVGAEDLVLLMCGFSRSPLLAISSQQSAVSCQLSARPFRTSIASRVALQEGPAARLSDESSAFDDDASAREDRLGRARDLATFVGVVIDLHVQG